MKSEEITRKNDTSLFVPDDDIVIETPSTSPSTADVSDVSTPTKTEEISSSEPTPVTPSTVVPLVETSGFVPVQTIEAELETEAQTEAAPEISVPSGTLAVDNTPWKPIDAQDPAPEPKVSTSPAPDTSSEPSLPDEETPEFDGSMHDLGNMALLVPPEVRNRSSTQTGKLNGGQQSKCPVSVNADRPFFSAVGAAPGNQCIKRDLEFCRGVLPYSETVLPNWVGDVNEVERNLSVPYFGIISETEW